MCQFIRSSFPASVRQSLIGWPSHGRQFPSLQSKLKRFEELERLLQDPAVLTDSISADPGAARVRRAGESGATRFASSIASKTKSPPRAKWPTDETDPDSQAYYTSELDKLVCAEGDRCRKSWKTLCWRATL